MTWDKYFFNIVHVIKGNSKCLSRKIGAILVRDNLIFSTGYNGPPEGIKTCDKRILTIKGATIDFSEHPNKCPRYVLGYKSGEGLDICLAAHAEENAILNAGVLGISTKGSTMYMTCGIPCKNCMIKIIRAGIVECVCTSFDIYDQATEELLKSCNVNFRLYDFLSNNNSH